MKILCIFCAIMIATSFNGEANVENDISNANIDGCVHPEGMTISSMIKVQQETWTDICCKSTSVLEAADDFMAFRRTARPDSDAEYIRCRMREILEVELEPSWQEVRHLIGLASIGFSCLEMYELLTNLVERLRRYSLTAAQRSLLSNNLAAIGWLNRMESAEFLSEAARVQYWSDIKFEDGQNVIEGAIDGRIESLRVAAVNGFKGMDRDLAIPYIEDLARDFPYDEGGITATNRVPHAIHRMLIEMKRRKDRLPPLHMHSRGFFCEKFDQLGDIVYPKID